MEIICLNTWGGRAGLPLLKQFFEKYSSADVFCLQEIWQTGDPSLIEARDPRLVPDIYSHIASWLPGHKSYFRPQYRGIYGLATFVKREIEVAAEGELFVFKEQGFENPVSIGNHGRNIQYLRIHGVKAKGADVNGKNGPLTLINFHGLWNGLGKGDSDDRILQSQKIAKFISELNHPFILAGDFNLNPDTESFRILSSVCSRDLIKDFGITSTRSSLYPKAGRLADYILTSEDIGVRSFEVLSEEVSDHLALRLLMHPL